MKSGTIRTLIADDRELFRKGLISIFEPERMFQVVGEAIDGPNALQLANDLRPDLLIIDLMISKLDGIAVCCRVRQICPSTEILILSDSPAEVRIREAFGFGARAFLNKNCDSSELLFAAKKAARGEYYVCGPVGDEMVAEYVRPLLKKQQPGGLMTPRERELARLLADGYSSKEAASVLNISPKTVEAHRASIMKKLNARNVTDIVKYCIRNHLIEP